MRTDYQRTDSRQTRQAAGELGASTQFTPASPHTQPLPIPEPQDRVAISPEAMSPEAPNLAARVNFESWGLGLGSQNPEQVQRQQGVVALRSAGPTPTAPATDSKERATDLTDPVGTAARIPDLGSLSIGEARAAQIAKNVDPARRSTPFTIDYEEPVLSLSLTA